MIPAWQWALIAAVILLCAAVVAMQPGSYSYAFLTGQCSHHPYAAECCHGGPRMGVNPCTVGDGKFRAR
jgi:hypothetical protein